MHVLLDGKNAAVRALAACFCGVSCRRIMIAHRCCPRPFDHLANLTRQFRRFGGVQESPDFGGLTVGPNQNLLALARMCVWLVTRGEFYPDPSGRPFGDVCLAGGRDILDFQLCRGGGQVLAPFGSPVVQLKGAPDNQNLQAKKPDHRPGPKKKETKTDTKSQRSKRRHDQQKTA